MAEPSGQDAAELESALWRLYRDFFDLAERKSAVRPRRHPLAD